MTHSDDFIRVHGARENNLKNINVETPKRALTVFTGVSGSGKCSVVFANGQAVERSSAAAALSLTVFGRTP
jgi:excinuclease UvrABC ATPase subunit